MRNDWIDFCKTVPSNDEIERNYQEMVDSYKKKEESKLGDFFEKAPATTDVVNKPAHYNTGTIECIDYLKDNMSREAYLGYLEGNAKKYLHRHRYKGHQIQDLSKAQWYLNRLVEELMNGE